MNVLVTGGAGYVGSIICEQLVARKFSVVILDNLVQGHKEAVPKAATFVEGDIADIALVRDILRNYRVDAVIHMAAETVISRSMTDPKVFFRENVIKASALLDAMLEENVRKLIFSSTAAVYGEPRQVPITEDHPEDPINPYGESKLMFEKILRWYHRVYGLKYAALRYFNAAGASEQIGENHEPESHLIPLILDAARGRRPEVQIYGTDYPTPDGTCVRDYIHVIDMADAHILALEKIEEIPSGAYNLGNNQGTSVMEVVEAARRVTGLPIPAKIGPRRIGDPAVLVASADRAKRSLGWNPRLADIGVIVESAWKWLQTHPQAYRAG